MQALCTAVLGIGWGLLRGFVGLDYALLVYTMWIFWLKEVSLFAILTRNISSNSLSPKFLSIYEYNS